ncbi:TNT domain-containing protein [Saccharothrix sp. SC076]|nr:TNT domain-containing protein [Saccharothrix obliqua]
MFPGGVLPPPRSAPARQLPAPPEDRDFAPGLRFEPQGHPDGHLVDTSARELPRRPAAPAGPPDPALLDGYDPQAGLHERDWDRRFLVRAEPPEHAWPPAELFPEGGYEAGQPGVLAVGVELDRFGTPEGRVLSETGTPFTQRSLPPTALTAGYRRYRVTRELPVWFTLSAGWFGQPGGGVRYRTTHPVAELVALGHLEEVR